MPGYHAVPGVQGSGVAMGTQRR